MKHFSSILRYIPRNVKVKKHTYMYNSLKIRGGGYKPPREVIEIRIRMYAEQHYHKRLSALTIDQRQTVAWCLYNNFGFSRPELAQLLSISSATIYRDISSIEFLVKRYQKRQQEVDDIRDYILYNAKYLPY